jgi:RHS repeat-associated protein
VDGFPRQPGVSIKDLLDGFTGSQFVQDQFDGDARPRDDGFAHHHIGIGYNPFHSPIHGFPSKETRNLYWLFYYGVIPKANRSRAHRAFFIPYRGAVAPTAVLAVPERVSAASIPVQWSANDPAPGSGVRHYDLAYRLERGELISRFPATAQTGASFEGEQGHAHTFYVSATDRVSNTGGWAEGSTKVVAARKNYSFAGQMVATRDNGVVYYLHGGHLGSTSLATNAGGAIVAEQRYYPYGEVRWVSGTLPTDLTFTGQRNEAGIGLMDYRARYYSPYLNQFVSPDPWPGSIHRPGSLHKYAYALNNPVNAVDPSGLQGCESGLGGICFSGGSSRGGYGRLDLDDEIIELKMQAIFERAHTPIDIVIEMFRYPDLPGKTASARLDFVLDRTLLGAERVRPVAPYVPRLLNQFFPAPTLYTGGGREFMGDQGMKAELGDEYLYLAWKRLPNARPHNGPRYPSPQVGHFLTAVAWGRWETTNLFTRVSDADMAFIVGHELSTDRFGESNLTMPLGVYRQLLIGATSPGKRLRFAAACNSLDDRDFWNLLLEPIGRPTWYSPQPIGDPKRVGNSIEDLRLSSLGWVLGQMIGNNELAKPRQVADWIQENIAD